MHTDTHTHTHPNTHTTHTTHKHTHLLACCTPHNAGPVPVRPASHPQEQVSHTHTLTCTQHAYLATPLTTGPVPVRPASQPQEQVSHTHLHSHTNHARRQHTRLAAPSHNTEPVTVRPASQPQGQVSHTHLHSHTNHARTQNSHTQHAHPLTTQGQCQSDQPLSHKSRCCKTCGLRTCGTFWTFAGEGI